MRNYMFDRGSSQTPAVWTAPAKTRRVNWKGVVIGILFLALIAALVAVTLVLHRMEGRLDATPSDSGYDGGDSVFGVRPGGSDGAEDQPRTTIPKSPAGVDPLMSVTGERGQTLSGTEIYQKVLPSVVSINAFSAKIGSSGSGVVLSSDGYIITNYHVIEGTRSASVTLLTNGETFMAKLVGYYEDLDIAVLKIEAEGLTPAEFGSSRELEVGETVYAIGNPMGYLYGSMTDGIVSALNRSITIEGHTMTLIQTSAALNSGNSGGALVNASGQVVGITSAKIDPPSDVTTENLGLAIPICDVRRCVNTLLRAGEMENPMVGITCQDWPGGAGVLVVEIVADGPAEKGGLLEGDVILTANGIAVDGVEELKDVIFDLGVGAEMVCTVLRDGEELELSFELYEA